MLYCTIVLLCLLGDAVINSINGFPLQLSLHTKTHRTYNI